MEIGGVLPNGEIGRKFPIPPKLLALINVERLAKNFILETKPTLEFVQMLGGRLGSPRTVEKLIAVLLPAYAGARIHARACEDIGELGRRAIRLTRLWDALVVLGFIYSLPEKPTWTTSLSNARAKDVENIADYRKAGKRVLGLAKERFNITDDAWVPSSYKEAVEEALHAQMRGFIGLVTAHQVSKMFPHFEKAMWEVVETCLGTKQGRALVDALLVDLAESGLPVSAKSFRWYDRVRARGRVWRTRARAARPGASKTAGDELSRENV